MNRKSLIGLGYKIEKEALAKGYYTYTLPFESSLMRKLFLDMVVACFALLDSSPVASVAKGVKK